jgi:NitT/TauT family transport system ATP-binding protein
VHIDLPRPRELRVKREPRFLEYEDAIWQSIEEEVRRASDRTVAPADAAG